jgi:hypothetical protein
MENLLRRKKYVFSSFQILQYVFLLQFGRFDRILYTIGTVKLFRDCPAKVPFCAVLQARACYYVEPHTLRMLVG